MNKKILIVVGGGTKHLGPFVEAAGEMGLLVDCVSFSDLEFKTGEGETRIMFKGSDAAGYDIVYLRLIGKRYEDAAILVYYLRQKGIRIVDQIYNSIQENPTIYGGDELNADMSSSLKGNPALLERGGRHERDGIIRVPLPKSIEAKMLADAHLPLPKTYFGRMKMIALAAPKLFGFPFVIKSTTGKQGHGVWSPTNSEELNKMVEEFTPLEKTTNVRFIAQEFVKASQRNRVFVIGGRAIAAITRPTRWRKRFQEKVAGEYPEGVKSALNPIPKADAELAVSAANALGIDIGGVDIITDDATGKKYILEVNSAPRWDSIKKDTGINVEKEILKYLSSI